MADWVNRPDKVEVEDDSGYKLPMIQLDDGRYAGLNFNKDTLNNSKSLRLRDDDILFCSYSKSGSHWIWQNVRLLMQGKITLDEVDKESAMLDVLSIEEIDRLPSPRLLSTHLFPDQLPPEAFKGKVKVIFVYRNPKDLAASFYHHHKNLKYYSYGGQFSDYLKRFADGKVSCNSVFEYLRCWEDCIKANPQIPFHAVSFEQFKLQPVTQRRRMSEFLGCPPRTDEFFRQVNNATGISVMRDLKGSYKGHTNHVFYRKGVVGDWMNHFTISENDWFDEVIKSKMAGSKIFKFYYTMDALSE